ncbi:MAG: hypothetical protein ACI9JL_000145 [Paracoccaceae bacterium]|jgi:hypothetical protein
MQQFVKTAACVFLLSLMAAPLSASPYSVELNLNGSAAAGLSTKFSIIAAVIRWNCRRTTAP